MTIEIASRLTSLRKDHGLSQEELAEKLGVSRQAVSKWERAESSPDTDNLIALAQLYGVTLDELIHGNQPDDAPPVQQPCDAAEEAFDPDNPLPNGSYFAHQEEEEQARQHQRQRMAFPYPVLVTAAYLALGFFFHLWHPGWIIFLTIPLYYLPHSQRGYVQLLGNPIMVTIIYLLLGTMCNLWHPGWLVFLLIPLLNWKR